MIVTQLDAAYTPWLDLFLSSLRLTNPDLRAYVELVNCHPSLFRFFTEKFPEGDFANVTLDKPTKNTLAHRKVDAALAVLARHPGEPWYLVCDVDLLFRGSLDQLVAGVTRHDAGIVFRDGFWEGKHYEHLRVACGFVAFRDHRLPEAWKSEMARPSCMGYEPTSWFYDQITLLSATQSLKLDYFAIDDRTYLNRDFSATAVVWSANLDPKEFMYLKFAEEFCRLGAG